MKINEVIGEWVIMPDTAKAVGLRKTGSHWEPINHSNNRANEDDLEEYSVQQQRPKIEVLQNIASRKDGRPFPLSYKYTGDNTASSGGQVLVAPQDARKFIAFYEKTSDENKELMQRALKSANTTVQLFKNIGLKAILQTSALADDAAGVGIITKQNTTADVKPGDEYKNVKKLKMENFADGKNPQDKGDSARHGIPKNATLAQLRKIRSSKSASPRKKQLAHWQINMRTGKKKK